MRIGIDFDNTIVCYDDVFYQSAVMKGLIPLSSVQTKQSIRDHLRALNQENTWTELQGYVYGPGMQFAHPFSGIISFLRLCKKFHIDVFIISHKTRFPYAGECYDLHAAAQKWLSDNIIIGDNHLISDIFFELTKDDKIKRISDLKCSHFIDDLPEFLLEPSFPPEVVRIQFDPHNSNPDSNNYDRFSSWKDISDFFMREINRL